MRHLHGAAQGTAEETPAAGAGHMAKATVKQGKPELRKKVRPLVGIRR